MKVSDIRLPEKIVDILKQDGIETLNEPQALSVRSGLLEGKNLVVASPTASGKTLIAELAILKKFLAGEKSVYLVPLKALASEKYEEFSAKYKNLGMRVAVSTGDYDSGDDWLGRYDLIILSNEKMDSALRHGAKWIADVRLVVSDEIHLIDDVSRGPTLEIVLTKLRQMTDSQIIALSATIQNAGEIAAWLKAKLVCSEYRPVKLRKGVFYPEGDVYVVDFLGETESIRKAGDGEVALCMDSIGKSKQSLVFVSTRKSAEASAEKIAAQTEKFLQPGERERLKQLSVEIENVLTSPTKQCRRLSRIVARGVAFHHAGIVAKQKKIIEEQFRKGLIKFIVATPTLAFGVNLPAYRVVVRDVKRYASDAYGSYFIPVFEVHQIMGRAGRPKYDREGEAIIMAKSEKEAEDLKERYILGSLEPIYSKLSSDPVLRMHVLSLIASETATTRKHLEKFFSQTFFAHQYHDIDEVMEKIEKVIAELQSYKFIKYDGDEKFISPEFRPAFSLSADAKLKATNVGKRVAELYIDPLSAKLLIDNADAKNDLGYLTVINRCAEMRPCLRAKNSDDVESSLVSMGIKIPDVWDIEYDGFLDAFKTALMLRDWANEINEDSLMDRYGITPGELYTKTLNAEWMLYAARELALLTAKKDGANSLNRLRLRIKYGVKKELLELVALKGIGRVRARHLWNNGIRGIKSLKAAKPPKIEKILGPQTAKSVLAQLGEDREEKFGRLKVRRRHFDG